MLKSDARHPAPIPQQTESPLLRDLTIDYGPPSVLGPFFLKADTAARNRGVSLSFGTFDDLLAANEANRANWRGLIGVFNPRHHDIAPGTAFCVLGRNGRGDVVAAHAARLLEWPETTYYREATSLRLFYKDPDTMKNPGESCEITAQSTHAISGRVVFSGAAWYHPDYRGRKLSAILPRIGKAYALAKWNPDHIVSMMVEDVHSRGFAPRFGYTNIDWEIRMTNSSLGSVKLAFLSMTPADVISYTRDFLEKFPEQLDRGVLDGGGEQPAVAVAGRKG